MPGTVLDAKNQWLRKERGISFEAVLDAISEGGVLDILEHRVRTNQRILVVRMCRRVYAVPFIEDADGNIILKTAYPSRKLQRRYGKNPEEDRS